MHDSATPEAGAFSSFARPDAPLPPKPQRLWSAPAASDVAAAAPYSAGLGLPMPVAMGMAPAAGEALKPPGLNPATISTALGESLNLEALADLALAQTAA